MKRVLAMLAVAIAASLAISKVMAQSYNAPAGGVPTPTSLTPSGDSTLGQMAGDIGGSYNAGAPATYGEGEWHQSDSGSKAGTPTTMNPVSDSSTIGSGINSAFSGARNAGDWWDASNLLDQVTDPTYAPDLSGQGAPDVPESLCGASADCNLCFSRVVNGLDAMRINLEKLRVAGQATSDLVSKSYAIGDGLSGVTGLAALQWQHERAGIAKNFDKFKGTYDAKYEGMMKGFKDVLDRWNACENQYGERDWYARFGFLYYQFMRDRYKRNF
jgi:hypothetical protein